MSKALQEFELRDDYLALYKLLKIQGFASSGAEAKQIVAQGMVRVNGEVETRKRKKLVAGDVVAIAGVKIEIGRQKDCEND